MKGDPKPKGKKFPTMAMSKAMKQKHMAKPEEMAEEEAEATKGGKYDPRHGMGT